MSLKNVKVGDKLRYLGGDPANEVELTRGSIYDVVDIDGDDIVINIVYNGIWAIGDAYKNAECFEIVEEEEEEVDKSTLDLVANLAQEVVKLRKQVEALSERVDSNRNDTVTFVEEFTAFKKEQEFANELFESDIVLLDERTQPEELAETVLGNITIRRNMYGDY